MIVEDEKDLGHALKKLLQSDGITATCVYDGEDGLSHALSDIYDVIVLDIMLPKKSGMEVLRALRAAKISAKVLMLSAKGELSDKVSGLNLGADDYLTKPFAPAELQARINALIRRGGSVMTDDALSFGALTLDRRTFVLAANDKQIVLSQKEYRLMELFMLHPGTVLAKEMLIERILGFDFEGEYNVIEVYITFLRRKLSAIHAPASIKSLRGRGYALENNDAD